MLVTTSWIKTPAIVSVVYHLMSHATVNADILTCDETCLFRAEIEHHISNIQRISYTSDWLLYGIRTFIYGIGGIYPTW